MMESGFVDLHLHALPGLDDGVRTVSDSVAMLSGLCELGFTSLVTTPHRDFRRWSYSDEALESAFASVKTAVAEAGLPIEFRLGCEYTYGEQFHSEINAGIARTIADTDLVLLELPEKHMPHAIPQALFQVGIAGYYPILAHPERCAPFQSNWEDLAELASGRALVQVSFRSLAGTFGRSIRKTAWRLVTEGVADLVATDCHSPRELKKVVAPVLKSLRKSLSPADLDRLMRSFPRSLLEGKGAVSR
jgi:protein-tyrosine phosphatase